MLDHMTFRVTDIQRAKAFYGAALAPLGYSLSFEGNYGMNILGFAYPGEYRTVVVCIRVYIHYCKIGS